MLTLAGQNLAASDWTMPKGERMLLLAVFKDGQFVMAKTGTASAEIFDILVPNSDGAIVLDLTAIARRTLT
jgi:hypothetical protein